MKAPTLSKESIQYIKDISRQRFPKEAVFGITEDGIAVEIENLHEDPDNHFKIDSVEFYSNNYVALVHSHTVKTGTPAHSQIYIDPRSPSECDLEVQEQMQIPWGILALDDDNTLDIIWFPQYDSEILGQRYISGVSDCLSVIQKWYWQKYNIRIPTVPHSPTWFEQDPDMYLKHYTEYGFYETTLKDIKEGDVIFIKLFHDTPTHAAVYVGNNKIWHHMANKLSCEEDITKWIKRISKVLTHKKGKK